MGKDNSEKSLLLARLLTRSGDQAWNFAVPIVLIQMFSKDPRPALVYFFLLMLGGVLFSPQLGRFIDKASRRQTIRFGIIGQMLGVTTTAILLLAWALARQDGDLFSGPKDIVFFAILSISGLVTQAGATLTDISVANDIVPSIIPSERISEFNSRFRRVDLLTEVLSPVAAGAILALAPDAVVHAGFLAVWLWNLMSFPFEWTLLKRVIDRNPSLNTIRRPLPALEKQGLWSRLVVGWPEFRTQAIARIMIAASILWLSVLSPHGVLLTAYLKNGWQLSEASIGIFRGL